ncbi:RNA polymerase sigma factor [Saccharopolyspora sp. 5N708]|uniref:RNA polymerase sigma factor n=1 Tax=Saccharopolyspora sp. 5N708 TaxID=3457424 RepID=UPI003FD0B268
MSDSFLSAESSSTPAQRPTASERRCDDSDLSDAVRQGCASAYRELYVRHVGAAYTVARQVTRSWVDADDFVSQAFANVLARLREGQGPSASFRAYLLTSVRHAAFERTRRDQRLQLAGDIAHVVSDDVGERFEDAAIAGLERSLAAHAFVSLPERWQMVLWHVEIEGRTPAQLAPYLGLTPSGVSALAYRARKGLRKAYRQASQASCSG